MEIAFIVCAVLCALVLLWLLLVVPGRRARGGFPFEKYHYAHRGLHNAERAENTLSAFRAAVEAGFGMELDVRLSRDGELVVFHDPDVSRVAGVPGRVSDMTAAELAALNLSGTGEGVPTFRAVLDAVAGRVPILVEIKEDTAAERDVTPRTLEMLASYDGPYLIESFNPLSVSRVKKYAPGTFRGFLCEHHSLKKEHRKPMYYLLQWFFFNAKCRPQFIAYNHEHADYFPFRFFKKVFPRTPLFAWTVRSQEAEDRAAANGFDAMIFENYIPKDKE